MLAKMTAKNQLTLPKTVTDARSLVYESPPFRAHVTASAMYLFR